MWRGGEGIGGGEGGATEKSVEGGCTNSTVGRRNLTRVSAFISNESLPWRSRYRALDRNPTLTEAPYEIPHAPTAGIHWCHYPGDQWPRLTAVCPPPPCSLCLSRFPPPSPVLRMCCTAWLPHCAVACGSPLRSTMLVWPSAAPSAARYARAALHRTMQYAVYTIHPLPG